MISDELRSRLKIASTTIGNDLINLQYKNAIEYCLSKDNLNAWYIENFHPLIYYIIDLGKNDLLEMILQEGADPNIRDIDNNTPLIQACRYGSSEQVELLLNYGADPKLKNNSNKTAEEWAKSRASWSKDSKIINVLNEYNSKLTKEIEMDELFTRTLAL